MPRGYATGATELAQPTDLHTAWSCEDLAVQVWVVARPRRPRVAPLRVSAPYRQCRPQSCVVCARIATTVGVRSPILGSLLARLEDRIKAYVFLGICGMTTFSPKEKKSMNVPTGATWARYAAQMSVSDNVAYVGHNKGAKLRFINGKDDVSATHDAKAFLAAASKASTWHVYAGGHYPSGAANTYWQAWMLKNP